MAFDFENLKNLLNNKRDQQKTARAADSRLFKNAALQDEGIDAGARKEDPALQQEVLPKPFYGQEDSDLNRVAKDEGASLNLQEQGTTLPSGRQSDVQTKIPQDLPKLSPFLQFQEEDDDKNDKAQDNLDASLLKDAQKETAGQAKESLHEEPAPLMPDTNEQGHEDTHHQSVQDVPADDFFEREAPALPQDLACKSALSSQENLPLPDDGNAGFLIGQENAAASNQKAGDARLSKPFSLEEFDKIDEAMQGSDAQSSVAQTAPGLSSNTKISGIDSDKFTKALQQQEETPGFDEVKDAPAQSTDESLSAQPHSHNGASILPQAFLERSLAVPPGARNALESNPLLKLKESSPFDEQVYAVAPSMAEAMALASDHEPPAPDPADPGAAMPSTQNEEQPYFEEESTQNDLKEQLLPPDQGVPAGQEFVNEEHQDLMAASGTLEGAPIKEPACKDGLPPQDKPPVLPQEEPLEPQNAFDAAGAEAPSALSQVPPAFWAQSSSAKSAQGPQESFNDKQSSVSSFIEAQAENTVEPPPPAKANQSDEALSQAQVTALNSDAPRTKEKLQEDLRAGQDAQERGYGFNFNYQSSSPNYADLACERQSAADKVKVAGYNDKETVPASMTILLYARQLAASFFTHSTLGVIAPRLALRLGPSYPSSTAFSFLVMGLIVGLLGVLALNIFDVTVAAGIIMIFYVLLCGLTEYRGIGFLAGLFSKRRTDPAIDAASVIFPATIFILVMQVFLSVSTAPEIILCLAAANMVAGAASSSLYFDLPQDPVDSLGTMSVKGLLYTLLFVCAASLVILEIQIACSILGIALLLRLMFGQYLINHNQNASRLHASALRHIILQAVMIDFIILGKDFNLLNHRLIEEVLGRFW